MLQPWNYWRRWLAAGLKSAPDFPRLKPYVSKLSSKYLKALMALHFNVSLQKLPDANSIIPRFIQPQDITHLSALI